MTRTPLCAGHLSSFQILAELALLEAVADGDLSVAVLSFIGTQKL